MRTFDHVFVLCTGRCGSTTFIKAAGHCTNYTSGHETRSGLVGPARLAYPTGSIESDMRLSWLLGRMERQFGDGPMYVHLQRNREATARSFLRRFHSGILYAYQSQILMKRSPDESPIEICMDYVDTVEANIDAFLLRKPHVLTVRLESAAGDFTRVWQAIGAEGDLSAALGEWQHRYNQTEPCEACLAEPSSCGLGCGCSCHDERLRYGSTVADKRARGARRGGRVRSRTGAIRLG